MLEMTVSAEILVLITAVSLVAGFVDAIAGGGALLTVPLLLTCGLPPHLALGTNKLSAFFGTGVASLTFYRRRLFEPRQWRRALSCTFFGSVIGATAAHYISADGLSAFIPVIVFACGIYVLCSKNRTTAHSGEAMAVSTRWQRTQGLGLGFYDGLAGVGTGAFWTVSTLMLHQIDLLRASGVARSMNFVSNITALSVFIWAGSVNWVIGLCMGLAVLAGSALGARSAVNGGVRFIKPIFITVVMIMTARLAYQNW